MVGCTVVTVCACVISGKASGSGGGLIERWLVMMNKSVNIPFPATIRKEGDGYIAQCPMTNTVSQGKTEEEALKNLAEAVRLTLVYQQKLSHWLSSIFCGVRMWPKKEESGVPTIAPEADFCIIAKKDYLKSGFEWKLEEVVREVLINGCREVSTRFIEGGYVVFNVYDW